MHGICFSNFLACAHICVCVCGFASLMYPCRGCAALLSCLPGHGRAAHIPAAITFQSILCLTQLMHFTAYTPPQAVVTDTRIIKGTRVLGQSLSPALQVIISTTIQCCNCNFKIYFKVHLFLAVQLGQSFTVFTRSLSVCCWLQLWTRLL